MKRETNPTWLVTGASGNLGRQVTELLLKKGGGHVIAGTRDPGKLADLAGKGAELRIVDFDKPETLAAAFAGVDRLVLVSTDAVMVPGQRIAQHQAAIRAAETAHVRHVVYTSTVDAEEDSALLVAPDHLATERALENSSLTYTILRDNYYADNLLPGLQHALLSGKWYSAARDGEISYVVRADCAAAAAEAVASDYDARRTLEITGPRTWTVDHVARLVSLITRKPLEVVHLSAPELITGMTGNGMPEPVARLITSFDQAAALGKLGPVTDAVKQLTGRAPEDLESFLQQLAEEH